MPPFPDSFPPKRETITTFDFTDVASGLGFEVFYPKTNEDSGGVNFYLSPLTLTSTIDQTQTQVGSVTTLNFDTSVFNLPRTVKGTAYCVFKLGITSLTGTSTASAQLFKVLADDSTVNLSSEITTRDMFQTSVADYVVELPLTQTTVKKGEKIRLAIKLLKDDTGSATMTYTHGGTDSPVYIPFRIDLT